RHAGPVVRVDKRDAEVVLELLLAERQTPARAADLVRRHRHVLGAAGEDELRLAELDLLRSEEDRLQARAAEPIHGQRGRFLWYARLQADMARKIHGVAGRLEDVAEDDLIDLLRIDLGFLERALRRDDPEVGCRGVAQGAAVRPKGRARAVDDD